MRIRYFVQTFAMAMICVGAAMLAHAQSASGNTNQSCVVGVQMVAATTTAMPIQADQ